jgi:hypothetical protein
MGLNLGGHVNAFLISRIPDFGLTIGRLQIILEV